MGIVSRRFILFRALILDEEAALEGMTTYGAHVAGPAVATLPQL
jgi:hypothetical protein